ncbi:MAG: hypothetical protein PVSMB6_04390 [Steroidobacteraceae bacterium]
MLMTPCLAANQHYAGAAYDGKGQVVYREDHWLYQAQDGPVRLVLYRCPSGEPFARKLVKAVPDTLAPDFDLIDARDGYREGVSTRDGRREVYVQMKGGAPVQSAPLPGQADAVIDAGFDAYVRARWAVLAGGQRLRVAFLVPSRLGYVNLTLGGASQSSVDGQPATRLRMSVDAWFGFIAPSIDLTYRTAERRLRRFEGPSNIHDDAGAEQRVRIEFPAALQFAPPGQPEIDAAAASPLVRRCPR